MVIIVYCLNAMPSHCECTLELTTNIVQIFMFINNTGVFGAFYVNTSLVHIQACTL
jgi:hypothetical protein